MANNLYIAITEQHSGRSSVVLGVMQLLLRSVRKVAFFRPIIQDLPEGQKDADIELVLEHFNLDMKYEDAYGVTLKEARDLVSSNQQDKLMEKLLEKYKALESQFGFVVCAGSDFMSADTAFEFNLNADIAVNLDCPIMLVANGFEKEPQEISDGIQSTVDLLCEKGADVPVIMLCRTDHSLETLQETITSLQDCKGDKSNAPLVYVMPNNDILSKPTVADIQANLNTKVIYGHNRMDNIVLDYAVVAMQADNFLERMKEGILVVTPGDRSDIMLLSLASRLSTTCPDVAGVLLTGGFEPTDAMQNLLSGLVDGVPIPILATEHDTITSVNNLFQMSSHIAANDFRKIHTAIGLFENCVDEAAITARLIDRKSSKVTPKMFEYMLIERAKSNKMRIVLPEGEEERVLRATEVLCNRNVAHIILLGNKEKILAKIKELGLSISGVEIIQPDADERLERYAEKYFEIRKAKGINVEAARDKMLDPTYFGTMMVHLDEADGMVSGAINTTAHTIRPAFEFIKTKPGVSVVSSVFFMCMKDRVLVFGDCAVNPNPTAPQLAEIAIGAAQTGKIFGVEPKIAMLSYSTGSSGKGADVDIVIEGTKIAREKAPDLLLEGPIQYDAAIDPGVAKTKMPNSPVAGQATVFIFPDLNTGNNTYKAVQRAADAVAVGPVLQGLNKPVNDLSRGCTVPDIINTVAITAIQAQAEKGLV